MNDKATHFLPVMRPRLATADRLLPYLRRIDASRIYSNFGPLALEFENRLREHLQLPAGTLVSAGSGLAALVGAILGTAGRATAARPLALMPSYTFVATAAATEQCGFQPCLDDIDRDNWMLDPRRALANPQLDRIGLVVPVSPYGRPVSMAGWLDFQERTGIPVVIDGAASFDTLANAVPAYTGKLPVAISFHATKSLGTGEGGCVVCADTEALDRISRSLNFGFHSVRDCRSPSTNGKMSEYHAAVGLAELDGWPEKLASFRHVAASYRNRLAVAGLAGLLHVSPEVGASYVLLLCADAAQSERVCRSLLESAIDFRFWYGLGLHRQSYYSNLPRQPLPVTDSIAPRLIGLPCAPDLDGESIARVSSALQAATA